MKKVIFNKRSDDEIPFSDIDPTTLSKYYWGVESDVGRHKGFIARIKYPDGEYRAFCIDCITVGNGWDLGPDATELTKTRLDLFLSYLGSKSWATIYRFDTYQELLGWMVTPRRP